MKMSIFPAECGQGDRFLHLWGISVEQLRILKVGARADGSKAERELGISYTPIEEAIKEAIDADRESH
jgi:hypothetical protein